ncbi:hypothetical protein KGA66_27055 [Actinocrinis puniceicyclus]|uniref:Uncharacterized protein n=1 Tax=Actinocrinis puniceicyclus TaxID=977794 RepID=A0A8J7WU18_9ACTN|nr:hypothetical protein [Actinocrinis puniceicyclus]MBS2966725.1 hypothetical protein [Actinocrinis puniceicyclus]
MATVVLIALGLVAALTYWRRLARRGALQLPKDLVTSAVLLGRAVYALVRFYVRFVLGEVRSW